MAMAATELSGGSDRDATEHTVVPQLAELVNPEAGSSIEIELKVIRNDLLDYTYTFKAKEVVTQKLQLVLQSKIPEQYCLGVAKLKNNDKAELKKLADRWQTGSTWSFKDITLLNEKSAYIHTSCRIAIDLRKSKVQALLQSTSFPPMPVPTVTIADVLQLKQMQRFDLMAIAAKILDERKAAAGMHIVDVRLVDGSEDDKSTTTEYASLPLTVFFKDAATLTDFKKHIGKTPLLFMCLTGNSNDGKASVATTKNQFWWQEAVGAKALAMGKEASEMCGDGAALKDVVALKTFTAGAAVDYISPLATLTVCQLVDPTCATLASLLGDATEHLYQLNHVYVPLPTKETSMKSKDNRLFARFDVWDHTKKITLAFRSKAMLQLASLGEGQEEEYEQQLASDELRHPICASLRLRIQSKPESDATATEHSQTRSSNLLSAVVVEAQPCTFTDIPNDAVEALHGLLAGSPQDSERLAVVPLDKLRPSPFYNMLADGKPVEKALTLLHFTQRSNGKQHSHGFRVVTERVRDATTSDATELTSKKNCYATVALCTVEKTPDFSAAKDTTAMAVVSKVVAPSKEVHTADLYIEAMDIVSKDDLPSAMKMMQQMQQISDTQSANPAESSEVAYRQRKCRRLQRYPTTK